MSIVSDWIDWLTNNAVKVLLLALIAWWVFRLVGRVFAPESSKPSPPPPAEEEGRRVDPPQ